MTDDDDVKIFIPKIHPEIFKLIESSVFRPSMLDLAEQGDDPDYFATQIWVDRIKAALANGVFSIPQGIKSMPKGLSDVADDTEVVAKYESFDCLMTASVVRTLIENDVSRQRSGKFHMDEVVATLGGGDFLYREAYKAFANGALQFFRVDDFPVDPSDRDLPLVYGEYTTPDAVNLWLERWGTPRRWPGKMQSTDSTVRRISRKALIEKYKNTWRSIDADLREASRNRLNTAKLEDKGFWDEDKAVQWAKERGYIEDINKKDKGSNWSCWVN